MPSSMDTALYKDFTTSRDLTYHYYKSAGKPRNGWIVLVHGFPSTSYDWRHQVPFFEREGYGLIVPDMLGYGGTSKPVDPADYRYSLVTRDIVELLDYECIHKPICIGHDWGAFVTSRLANRYPERFTAFGFLAVGYTPPNLGPQVPFEDFLAALKQAIGYEPFGYWLFFSADGADKIVEAHMDSFLSLIFAEDTKIHVEHLAPRGALQQWLEEDRKTAHGSYVSDEDLKKRGHELIAGGMAGPCCYYKIATSSIDYEDGLSIPAGNVTIEKPVFLGTAGRDYVVVPSITKRGQAFCKDLTVHEYDASHWLLIEAHEQLNCDLLAWIRLHSPSKL